MTEYLAPAPQKPKINFCMSCGNLGLDENKEWYCASEAARKITPDCVSVAIMYSSGMCGPKANWKLFEKAR